MTSFLFDQSLPHGGLGDSTSASILPQQSKQATRERSSSPLKQQQQHTDDGESSRQVAEESANPLRELSRLVGDKSTVIQHAPPSTSAGERSMMAGNLSQWALPQGCENMSNIMNASLPPSSQLLNADNTMAFDRSHFVSPAPTGDQSTANAGNVTTFNKLDMKGLDGTFLLDESLPHHLANVSSNISMFQPASSNSRLKKAPSKLVRHQPMILEEEGSGGEDNDEGDYSYVLPASPSSKPRQKPAHKGSLSPGKTLANENRSPSQGSSSHQQQSDNQFLAPPAQTYSPPRSTPTAQTGSPLRVAATHQPVQLSHTRVQQTKRQSIGTHKRQSSLQSLPTKEAATAKNNLGSSHSGGGSKPSSSEGRVRSMLSRDSRSSPARPSKASGMTPSASSSALRTPSKLSGAEAAARQQQQAERSARRTQTYEEFKEFLPALPQSASKPTPPAQGKPTGSAGPGITRSRTTSSLSSLQPPQAGTSKMPSKATPATVSRMPASRTSTDLRSQAQPARNPPATVSRMPMSRTSTDLRTQGPPARISRMPTARSSTDLRSQAQPAPQSGSALKRKAPNATTPSSGPNSRPSTTSGGGITRSQSTPSVSAASSSSGPPAKKRVSIVPPKRTSERPPPMPSSSSQTKLNQAMANKAPAPLGSRYGIPASTSATQLSGRSSAAPRPSATQQPRVRMLRPGESSAAPTGTSSRSQPRQRL